MPLILFLFSLIFPFFPCPSFSSSTPYPFSHYLSLLLSFNLYFFVPLLLYVFILLSFSFMLPRRFSIFFSIRDIFLHFSSYFFLSSYPLATVFHAGADRSPWLWRSARTNYSSPAGTAANVSEWTKPDDQQMAGQHQALEKRTVASNLLWLTYGAPEQWHMDLPAGTGKEKGRIFFPLVSFSANLRLFRPWPPSSRGLLPLTPPCVITSSHQVFREAGG